MSGGDELSDRYLNALLVQNILHNIVEGIHVIDRDGVTVYYNESMEKIEGLKKENVIDRHVLEVFPNLNPKTSTLLKAMDTGKEIKRERQTYLNFKGQRISSINVTIPLKEKMQIIGAIEIARNITDVHKMSEKLADLQIKLYGKGGLEKERGKLYEFGDILGESLSIKKIVNHAKKAAINDSNVFIYGETGTGKELFAQSIHGASRRNESPFIAQNCAALPESLLEGILFGTAKGGFTGAIDRPGLFEQASGGTLFLDEINSMSIHLQAKILRVLQENYIRRVGGLGDIDTDVRIIVASNEDPELAIKNGHLRKDLYYRVNVIGLNIIPLRERCEDLGLFANHFIAYFNEKYKMDVKGIVPEVKDYFEVYEWPGNVRELKNVLESAMNVTSSDFISMEDLPDYIKQKTTKHDISKKSDMKRFIEETEKCMIIEMLGKAGWNITVASKELGISRQNLQYKIKKYSLK
jgi:arginine utilization regulatory protein